MARHPVRTRRVLTGRNRDDGRRRFCRFLAATATYRYAWRLTCSRRVPRQPLWDSAETGRTVHIAFFVRRRREGAGVRQGRNVLRHHAADARRQRRRASRAIKCCDCAAQLTSRAEHAPPDLRRASARKPWACREALLRRSRTSASVSLICPLNSCESS